MDYTLFLISRARGESLKHVIREGTTRAAALTGGAITSAGIVLASIFPAQRIPDNSGVFGPG